MNLMIQYVISCENMEIHELGKAKQKNLKSWKNFGVYEEVPNMSQKALLV